MYNITLCQIDLTLFKQISHWNKSFYFRYAGQVSIGDEVLVEISNYLTPRKVIDISSSSMQGDYHFYFFKNTVSLYFIYIQSVYLFIVFTI